MDQTSKPEKIRCDACPVMCYIAEGKSGACDRYANKDGQIIRSNVVRKHLGKIKNSQEGLF